MALVKLVITYMYHDVSVLSGYKDATNITLQNKFQENNSAGRFDNTEFYVYSTKDVQTQTGLKYQNERKIFGSQRGSAST